MTKRQQTIIDNYNRAKAKSISECYAKPSDAKYIAECAIKQEMYNDGGYDYRILSYNTMMFTCAYRTDNAVVYHTPTRIEVIALG